MARQIISTPNAPAAIGPYSQAVKAGNLVYLSGQIGLDPATMEMVDGVEAQARQVFANLKAVCEAAGGSLGDAVKLTIYLTDLANFGVVNEIMKSCFVEPSRRVPRWACASCRAARWSRPIWCWSSTERRPAPWGQWNRRKAGRASASSSPAGSPSWTCVARVTCCCTCRCVTKTRPG